MPSRVIRDDIRVSEGLSRVSMQAELAFDRLLIAVDEFGRLDARQRILKAELFACRDEVSGEDCMRWIAELEAEDAVRIYPGEKYPVLQVTNCERYRAKRNRRSESKLPAPDGTYGAWSPSAEATKAPSLEDEASESPQNSAESDGGARDSAVLGQGVRGSKGSGGHVSFGAGAPPAAPPDGEATQAPEIRGQDPPEQVARTPSPTDRARFVWPQLVSAAAGHGASWAPKPGVAQLRSVASRIRDGASEDDLESAIHGAMALWSGGDDRGDWDPIKYLRPSTLYGPTKFPEYVQAHRAKPQSASLDDRVEAHLAKLQAGSEKAAGGAP